MKAILATNNMHKVDEFKRFFADAGISIELIPIKESGFTGEIIENADTFEGNAFIKADALCRYSGMISIADDSGLCVDALGGAPGVYSSRYSGAFANDAKNNAKLLSELKDVPFEKRTARFVSVICVRRPDGKALYVRGEAEGFILESPRGKGTFGYDPLFYYPPLKKTFAELEGGEKNAVSHRGNALKALAEHKEFFDTRCE